MATGPTRRLIPQRARKTVRREDTLLVSASDKIPNKGLRSIVLGWLQKYQQQAAVVKYADSDVAYLLAADASEKPLGKWSVDRLADTYSQMRWGPGGRTFVFEAADEHSWSARLAISTMEKELARKDR